MKVQLSDEIIYNVVFDEDKLSKDSLPVVFLHGFSGSSKDWEFISDKLPSRFTPIAIDLLGHGETSSPENVEEYYFLRQNSYLKKIFEKLNISNCILTGYSMGGRAALTFTFANPGLVQALILESSTAGIPDFEERLAREELDEQLADRIELFGIDKFVDYWMNISLFNSLKNIPEAKYAEVISHKLNNNKVGLANSLRGFGTGTMPPLWNELINIRQKVFLITGELDEKFTGLNLKMKEELPDSGHYIIQNAGHNVHLEKPEDFINLINYILREI